MSEGPQRSVEVLYETPQVPYFKTLATGFFGPGEVNVSFHGSQTMPPELQSRIDQVNCIGGIGKRSTYAMRNEPTVRNGQLQLDVERSDFDTYTAVNTKEWRNKYGEYYGKPIGTSMLIETADNQLIVTARFKAPEIGKSPSISTRGSLHVLGGFPEVDFDLLHNKLPDSSVAGEWDPFMTVRREVKEEVGLDIDPSETYALGVIYNNHESSSQPIIPFSGRTHLTAAEVAKQEFERGITVRFIKKDQALLEKLLTSYPAAHTPTALANLLLYGEKEYGDLWYRRTASRIKAADWSYKALNEEGQMAYREKGKEEFYNLSTAA